MIGNLDDETNFPDKLLLTNRQVANLRRAFAKHAPIDIKLPIIDDDTIRRISW